EMYIFLDDTADSHDFIGLLKSKARAGIEVAIIADAFGSLNLKHQTIVDLREAGVEILFFSRFWHRTHRKIVVIDKRIAFVGGVNIEKKIINWQDIQIKMEGNKTVKAILRSFARTYQSCGGKKKHIISYHHKSLLKKIKSLVLENLPIHNINSLMDYYKDKIISAQKSIKIITPYFIPPRWLMALLDDARRRNIEIEIIIPRNTDINIINKVNYSYVSQLKPSGIKFYANPKMNHAKILIVDENEALVGSQNLDSFSFGLNLEVGVFFKQREIVKELTQIFNIWRDQSPPFQAAKIRLNWWEQIKVNIMRLFLSII
ncbi:MAG: phosphatidylserine/phosphatidylglycerophosphate/cardiolipin synthase family protein, partial [Patescibacteria group bacterium]